MLIRPVRSASAFLCLLIPEKGICLKTKGVKTKMSWTKSDYPNSLNNLPTEVRNKAIEIANALLDEGYEEGRAIAIATEQARKNIEDHTDKQQFHVKTHENGWQLIKEEGNQAIFVEDTKENLLEQAKQYANKKEGILVVHRQDGSVEQRLYDT
jgi:uncharacterized protein YdaT